jgi:hypothetical protein
MSRKYVAQVNNQNFVYPNQNLVEYDVEIVHDINDNCVIGTISGLTATTISTTGITFSHTRTFNMNGAEPFSNNFINPLYTVPYLSIHCQVPNQTYMNTWRLVDYEAVNTTTPNTVVVTGGTNTFTIVPSQFGLTSFSSGTYSFEFRFIGQNCLYRICSSMTVNIATPTPTPTPSSTPTPTPTATSVPGSPVDFSISNTCVGQIGYLTISGGTGGSGTYQFNQYYYASEAAASGTTTGYTVSTDAVWSNIPDGTWYFVMRDNTDNSNKIVKSAVVNCDSNPPSCVTGVTFNVLDTPIELFFLDCEGVVQSVEYFTTGSKTIVDCLQVNSLSSPNEEDYNNIVYASTVCSPATPTPTPTATPTPTPVCSCYFHNAIIGQADLDAATGNTDTFRNNKVYTGYFDCNGNEAFKAYTTAGTYTNDLCPNGVPVNVYYYKDNSATLASASSVVNTGVCCTVPTPTPTSTNTPTPTPTSTPTPTATPAPIGDCYCYEIWVTGTTSGEGNIATLDYNDCFNTRTLRAFTTGPLIYKQCIQTLDGVPQVFEGTEGIDESKIVIPGTGNCNTGFDCSGTSPIPTATPTPTPTGVPPTNTPTPTPTATGVPPTNTPTPTPTATSTPTATPIPPDCVTSVSFEVDEAGLVSYLNCCGSSVTGFYSIGPQVINDCIDFGTLSGPISSISYGSTSCTCVTPTPTPTATGVPPTDTPTPTPTGVPPTATPTPTPTATTIPLTTYTGCGRGNTYEGTCSDAGNNRTFYSDCGPFDFAVGCYVYVDTFPNPLVGYEYVFINGATWDINNSTGQITALSIIQC